MTDTRQILERCAKVMGLGYIATAVWVENGFYSPLSKERINWNPLTNLADAADMAIKCKVDVVWMRYEVWATQNGKGVAVPFKDHPTETAAYCWAVCQVVAQMGGE